MRLEPITQVAAVGLGTGAGVPVSLRQFRDSFLLLQLDLRNEGHQADASRATSGVRPLLPCSCAQQIADAARPCPLCPVLAAAKVFEQPLDGSEEENCERDS